VFLKDVYKFSWMYVPTDQVYYVGFEVFKAVSMKIAVFWVVAIALMMEAARTSETLVNFYQTTWCYNPEDSNLQVYYVPIWCFCFLLYEHLQKTFNRINRERIFIYQNQYLA
jgi:hypothetical protein